MSDPVTNVEIEDVLSSIRRLVSTEDRSEKTGVAAKENSESKLVLTPSLRVDEMDGAESADEMTATGADVAGSAIEAEAIEKKAKFAEEPLATESKPNAEGSTQLDVDSHEEFLWRHTEVSDEDLDRDGSDDEVEAGAENDTQADSDATNDDAVDTGKSETANGDVWDNDESNDDGVSDEGDSADKDKDVDVAMQGDEVALQGDEPDNSTHESAPEPKKDDRLGELKARVAEFEALVAARDDQWEPDGTSTDAYSGGAVSPLPWSENVPGQDVASDTSADRADSAEVDPFDLDENVTDATDDPVQATNDPENHDNFPEEAVLNLDDAVLDEEALRDMISEIVRQELQGALGERITRNVRKLVRREIHRALTSQQLE